MNEKKRQEVETYFGLYCKGRSIMKRLFIQNFFKSVKVVFRNNRKV